MTEFGFPLQDRDDHLLEYRDVVKASIDQGHIDKTEGDIAHKVAGKLLTEGAVSVGEAADLFEAKSQAEQRELVDEARASLGLESLRELAHYEARRQAAQNAAGGYKPRLVFDGMKYVQVDDRSEDDLVRIGPRFNVIPSKNELKRAKARVEAEREEREEQKERDQRGAEAIAKVEENCGRTRRSTSPGSESILTGG